MSADLPQAVEAKEKEAEEVKVEEAGLGSNDRRK